MTLKKLTIIMTMAVIMCGGILFGSVDANADTTQKCPHKPQNCALTDETTTTDKSIVDADNETKTADADKTADKMVVATPQALRVSKPSASAPPSAAAPRGVVGGSQPVSVSPPVSSSPSHQHHFVAVYKTVTEQTGTKTVIHKYCYKCKADITYENIEEHLKNCGTDMYSTKKIVEPVYADVQIVDFWKCECGEVKAECLN